MTGIESAQMAGTNVDGIPVLHISPAGAPRGLFLHLPAFGQSKEATAPVLQRLADRGYIAASLDPWQHGERGSDGWQSRLHGLVSKNFRRNMWPILGQTTLDVSRVIDWALATFDIGPPVVVSGVSMGGDIAVAAAGHDPRIAEVIAIIATADWKRPGMHDFAEPPRLFPPGEPDLYARFFYDHLDPMTNLGRYARGPALHFICGDRDTHVPPEGAALFRDALARAHPHAAEQVAITLMPGLGHLDFGDLESWWPHLAQHLPDHGDDRGGRPAPDHPRGGAAAEHRAVVAPDAAGRMVRPFGSRCTTLLRRVFGKPTPGSGNGAAE